MVTIRPRNVKVMGREFIVQIECFEDRNKLYFSARCRNRECPWPLAAPAPLLYPIFTGISEATCLAAERPAPYLSWFSRDYVNWENRFRDLGNCVNWETMRGYVGATRTDEIVSTIDYVCD